MGQNQGGKMKNQCGVIRTLFFPFCLMLLSDLSEAWFLLCSFLFLPIFLSQRERKKLIW